MFFKEIGDLGALVVICGIFLYFVKKVFDLVINDIKKSNEKIISELQAGKQTKKGKDNGKST